MSTSAYIFIQNKNNTYKGISVHYDGDIYHTGDILARCYDYIKTQKLVAKGSCVALEEQLEDIEFYKNGEIFTDLQTSGYVYLITPSGDWYINRILNKELHQPYVSKFDGQPFLPLKMYLVRNGLYPTNKPVHIGTKTLYATKYLTLFAEIYQSPSALPQVYYQVKRTQDTDITNKPVDAVTMFVTNEAGDKALVTSEFRYTVNEYVTDLPSGLVDPGESIIETAIRELQEETGYTDPKINHILPESYSSVGMTNERVQVVFMTVDEKNRGHVSHIGGEQLKSKWVTKDEAKYLLAQHNLSGRAQLLLFNWVYSK